MINKLLHFTYDFRSVCALDFYVKMLCSYVYNLITLHSELTYVIEYFS